MKILSSLEPKEVFKYFEDICAIPHGSGNTKAISDYCVEFAKQYGLEYVQDGLNNIIIKKPATKGYEKHPSVILQGHLDMVCESKIPFDFATSPLNLRTDGEWIWADGTTLGADDGIAVAMILAILSDNTLQHPDIEAVFTVDEETGMFGAAALDYSLLKSNTMINIDSENEGVLTVSCAGGAHVDLALPLSPKTEKAYCKKITVGGLIGGHSGVEIDKGRLNANKVMANFLKSLNAPFRIAQYAGGSKDNAITRECVCYISTDTDLRSLAQIFEEANRTNEDKDLTVEISDNTEQREVYSCQDSLKIVNLISALPYGVIKMSEEINGLVETSLNIGVVDISENVLHCRFAVRSSVPEEKEKLINKLTDIIEKFNGKANVSGEYPAWVFCKDSRLQGIMKHVYKDLFGSEIKVEAIHAGLECGLFCEKIKSFDAVSVGPDMENIHTPAERLSVKSTKSTYQYICETLKKL